MNGVLSWFADPANWRGANGVPTRFIEHLGLSAAALGLACLIALPIALWLGHKGKGGTLAINISNVGRAIPTFALLALLALGVFGFNALSTVVALTLFGIPPVLTNAYIAIREVDRDVVEAASGMGMDAPTMIRKVELPLAVPLIINGIRLAAVQIVATATIAALVGGGGLGRIITSGFGRQDTPALVSGAILVAVFAVAVEGVFALVQRRVDPARARARQSGSNAGPGRSSSDGGGPAQPSAAEAMSAT